MRDTIPTTRETHPWVAEARNTIRFAIVSGPFPEWSQTVEFVQQAEALGFDAFWANDHPLRAMDCWTTLSALAAVTTTIRLLPLVSCIYYRSPALTARMAADVDRLSNGRLVLGIGIGDDTQEFEQLSIPFPSTRVRQQTLEEALDVIMGMWGDEPFSYNGTYFQVSGARMRPQPIQQPHVPIMIAGGGERVTLRQVARFADMSNFGAHEWTGSAYDLDDVRRKCEALHRHCDALGRSYHSILRSHYTALLVLTETEREAEQKRAAFVPNPREHFIPFFGTPVQAIAHFQALVDAGMQYFLTVIRASDATTSRLLAERVMPEIRPR